MRIKKIAPVTPANGNIENSYGTSQENTYSQEYINKFTDYSTTEQVIGKWIDGKPLYRKVIDFGALPNTSEKNANHNIANLDMFTSINAISYNPTLNTFFYIPLASTSSNSANIYILATPDQVRIGTGSDRSGFTKTYIILEYTKTTD